MSFTSKGNLHIQADCYQFAADDGKTRLEIAYSFLLSQFDEEKFKNDSLFLNINLQITDLQQKPLFKISEQKKFHLNPNNGNDDNLFIDLKKYILIPGEIIIKLNVSDANNYYQGIIDKNLNVRDFSTELSLSDPVFVAFLDKAKENSIFNRQNIFALPNPQRKIIIKNNQHNLLLFLEINNLQYNPQVKGYYTLHYNIEDLSGNSLKVLDNEAIQKIAKNTSRIEKIDLSEIPSGMYRLILNLTDLTTADGFSLKRYFQIENMLIQPGSVLPMSDQDIQKYYDQIKYIATNKELEIFRNLDNNGKQRFLLQFWKSKDKTPDTPENEFMEEHFKRMAYCEKNFQRGVNSDRARIYIKYGPPVNIERRASTLGYSKPVEIWTYAFDGSIEFVFVDRTNDGNYVLVHSTHPDEYSNPDWMKNFSN